MGNKIEKVCCCINANEENDSKIEKVTKNINFNHFYKKIIENDKSELL